MAAHGTLQLVIASVGETYFSGEVVSVTLPGESGELTLLPHHEPIVTILKPGVITVRTEGEQNKRFDVESGVLEMSDNHAIVLL